MNVIKGLVLLGMVLTLSACGSGDYGNSTNTANTANAVVSGVASAGIISGGTVKVFAAYSSANEVKKQLGSTGTTDGNGNYSIAINGYSGPVIIEVTGGTYTDEATGTTQVIPAAAPLRAAVNVTSGTVSTAVTPLTELALRLAKSAAKKLTTANMDAANSMISQLFKMDIVATSPVAPSAAAFESATQAQKDYALALATISELMKTNGTDLTSTLAALLGKITIAGGITDSATVTSLSTALSAFLADTTYNLTGVTDLSGTGLQNIGTTTVTLTIALGGTTTTVKGGQTTINLPAGAGISVRNDADHLTLDGVLAQNVGTSFLYGGYSESASTLVLNFGNANSSALVAGNITVTLDLAQGAATPAASAFSLTNTKLVDGSGATVSGATLSVSTLAAP